MLRKLERHESIDTVKFGGYCPYWAEIQGQIVLADTAAEIVSYMPEASRIIDPVAVLELLQFNYILGDRTIVRGIQRMPWRGRLMGDGSIVRFPPLPHDNRAIAPVEAARQLRELLTKEIYDVVRNHERVYLLLTGGLDSRVVSGILKKIEPMLHSEIRCVTWGMVKSRDVAYARAIANWYDWEFIHINYDAELTWENICRSPAWDVSEAAGIHLHNMEWFKNVRANDLVIAASFGDSVGRAEFSSIHLSNLKLAPIINTYNLINPWIAHECITAAEKDRESAWDGAVDSPEWVKYELDMQENYMRRLINHEMNYIRQYCKLHQAFTSDAVVSYMWSISPDSRTDDIYKALLKDLDHRLYSLPWARNGISFDGEADPDASLTKNYHEIGKWLKTQLKQKLEPLYFSPGLQQLGLFDTTRMQTMWNQWQAEPLDELGNGENIVKISSLEISRQKYGLRPCSHLIDKLYYVARMSIRGIRNKFSRSLINS